MAPVTRRRSKAAFSQNSQETAEKIPATGNEAPQSPEEPIALNSERKSSPETEEPIASEDTQEQTTPPKRQKLAVRVREEGGTEDQRRVSIEAQLLSQKSKRDPSDLVADSQGEDDVDDNEDDEIEPQSVSKQLQAEAMKRQSTTDAAPTPVPAKAKHVVFGDDDDVENFVAAVKETTSQPAVEDAEEEEDDDEAPEAVSTKTAARVTLKSEQAVSEAADKQAASLKRKRKERDDLFKQQAEKRKRTIKLEIHQSKATDNARDESDSRNELVEVEKATTSGRRRAEKFNLHGMLPAEFLTDSESDDDDEKALKAVKKPKKITFDAAVQTLGKEGKAPRDQIVGSTVYRVMADERNDKLAPKMNKNSRNLKDALLRRNRVGVTLAKSKGFLKKR